MVLASIHNPASSTPEQRFTLPGFHTWQQFKAIQASIEDVPGVRISYLDGCVEFMTVGEEHEILKTIIGALIELFFLHNQIEFVPVGSATREAEERGASFEPDESYYIGEKKKHPDLAVEVIITSGGIEKLEKYKRFGVREVWFWQTNELSIYNFRDVNYEKVANSELLPDFDRDLFVRCIKKNSKLEAMTDFMKGLSED
ncbi:Uma2 family endonuclease [Oscillatoriales cyanobacterium LEGE 11467]|uniref:Uma2 family endonuclease n=1 Tax=Zarconia navalis LEGE 11467 TaxID=1828826 RepID=A0A928Z689_9CYAN|nr:Uma2 family endonuclease [Zarconia navalis LEGE 11467]